MKGSSMNTHMGNIVIDNEVIAQYAGSVAVECFGIVGMAGVSMKDGLVSCLRWTASPEASMCPWTTINWFWTST